MLTRKELKEHAKERLRGRATTGVLVTLILFAIVWGMELFMIGVWGLGNLVSETAGIVAMAAICIVWVVMAWVLSTGYCWAFLKINREQKTGIEELFRPFQLFGKVLGVFALIFAIVMVIYVIGMLLVVLAALAHPALTAIPGVALIILLYDISLGLALVPYLLYDQPELGIRACIKRSMELMKGHKWELFVLCLSFIWWYLLTAITCGVASLWVGPYVNTTLAKYYDELIGFDNDNQAQKETIEQVTGTEPTE